MGFVFAFAVRVMEVVGRLLNVGYERVDYDRVRGSLDSGVYYTLFRVCGVDLLLRSVSCNDLCHCYCMLGCFSSYAMVPYSYYMLI